MDKSRLQTDKIFQTLSLPSFHQSEVLVYMTVTKEIMELFPKEFLTRNSFQTTAIYLNLF